MQPNQARDELRGPVLRYDAPTEPVGVEDWEILPTPNRPGSEPPSDPPAQDRDERPDSESNPS